MTNQKKVKVTKLKKVKVIIAIIPALTITNVVDLKLVKIKMNVSKQNVLHTTITKTEIMNVCVGVKTHLKTLVITLVKVGVTLKMVEIPLLTALQIFGTLLMDTYGLMIIVLLMLLMVPTVPTMTPEILLVMVQDFSDLNDYALKIKNTKIRKMQLLNFIRLTLFLI